MKFHSHINLLPRVGIGVDDAHLIPLSNLRTLNAVGQSNYSSFPRVSGKQKTNRTKDNSKHNKCIFTLIFKSRPQKNFSPHIRILILLFYFISLVPVSLKRQSRENWNQTSWTCTVMNPHQISQTARSWKKVLRHTRLASISLTHTWCLFVCLLALRFLCRLLLSWAIITAVFVREWRKIFHAETMNKKKTFKKGLVDKKTIRTWVICVSTRVTPPCWKVRSRVRIVGSGTDSIIGKQDQQQTKITTATNNNQYNIYGCDIYGYGYKCTRSLASRRQLNGSQKGR